MLYYMVQLLYTHKFRSHLHDAKFCGGLRYLTLEGTYILTCMDETKLKSYTIMALMLTCRTSGPIVAKDYAK